MTETNEFGDRERRSVHSEDVPQSGLSDASPSRENETSSENPESFGTPPFLEPTSGPQPSSDPLPSADDFAESVILGLEQAVFHNDEPSDHDNGTVTPLVDNVDVTAITDDNQYQTYFSGWGQDLPMESVTQTAPLEEPENTSSEDRSEAPLLHQTQPGDLFASLAETNRLAQARVNDETEDDQKHDALADAVQSALLSVYGNPTSESSFKPSFKSSPSPEVQTVQSSAVLSDDLSPQDVILNYFNYGTTSQETKTNSVPVEMPQTLMPEVSTLPPAVYANDSFAQSKQTPTPASARYDGPTSLPVPARPQFETQKQTSKESSRFLGAAGIGLIGGIAIAASLAVFTINSYGPQIPKSPDDARQGADSYGTGNQPSSNSVVTRPLPTPRLAIETAKPVTTPEPVSEVLVADAAAAPGQPIPLSINVKTSRPLEQTLISISGIPQGGRLNAGVDAGGGNWLLPPKRLNGLTLSLPANSGEKLVLEAELLESNLRTPLSSKQRFSVRNSGSEAVASASNNSQSANTNQLPVLNIPEAGFSTQTVTAPKSQETASLQANSTSRTFNTQTFAAQSAPSTNSQIVTSSIAPSPSQVITSVQTTQPAPQLVEIEDLIREGNKKMREGDIVQARELYLQAVNLGDADAALAMGRSFDPIYFERITNRNADADPAKAFEWYKRALDSGAAQTARVRIENLKQHLNK